MNQLPPNPEWYSEVLRPHAQVLSSQELMHLYRVLNKTDLYFLLAFTLTTRTIEDKINGGSIWKRPWLFDRCREVQESPNDHVDVWAREHFKSTIITFGLTNLELLNNVELTYCILSYTRPIAKGFLRQHKIEWQENALLKRLHPEVFWTDPAKESPKWSEDEGLVLKRAGNRREATIEAYGLIDGQPTSRHYDVLVYDDPIEESTVTNPEMIEKVRKKWELSSNLGVEGGKKRYIGTRYHFQDLYHTIGEDREVAKIRKHPAMEPPNITEGVPVLQSREYIEQKFKEQGPYTFAAQMLCDPVAEDEMGFDKRWLRKYAKSPWEVRDGMNVYLLYDPANEKKKNSDYTVFAVVGLGADRNKYLLDLFRDRLNLKERGDLLFTLVSTWKPLQVRVEKYGMMADSQYFQLKQEELNYRFPIVECSDPIRKEDRIRRLVPCMQEGRFFVPNQIFHEDYQGKEYEAVKLLELEMDSFPVGLHDDILDALCRIEQPEMTLQWPEMDVQRIETRRERWYRKDPSEAQPKRDWVTA